MRKDIEANQVHYEKFKRGQLTVPSIQKEIREFMEGQGDFYDQEAYGSNSLEFWYTMKDKVMSRVSIIILQTVSHVTDCERTWSIYGLVHTKIRNRLTTASVGKILKLRHSLTAELNKGKTNIEVAKKYFQLLVSSSLDRRWKWEPTTKTPH